MIEDLTNKIEALLFSAAKITSLELIEEVIGISDKAAVKNAIKELQQRYEGTSLMVVEDGGGYKVTVKEKYVPIITKIVVDTELNKATMETLAVIAWKAPVLQSEIIKVRSNKAYDHISELKEAEFIIKEKEGRSYKIKLAPKFFEYFDIRSKEDIKKKFEEVEEKAEERYTKRLEEQAAKEEEQMKKQEIPEKEEQSKAEKTEDEKEPEARADSPEKGQKKKEDLEKEKSEKTPEDIPEREEMKRPEIKKAIEDLEKETKKPEEKEKEE